MIKKLRLPRFLFLQKLEKIKMLPSEMMNRKGIKKNSFKSHRGWSKGWFQYLLCLYYFSRKE